MRELHGQQTGILFVISAPSGAGKTSLVERLLQEDNHLSLSVSHTTRPPRQGEVDGQHYHFVSHQTFNDLIAADIFLEHAEVFDNHYGTSSTWVRGQLEHGIDVLLEIDWQGAQQVRRLVPDCVGIFILPPSIKVLHDRLCKRAQDDDAVIEYRLEQAAQDIGHADEFDYVVVNENFEQACVELLGIIAGCRLRLPVQPNRHRKLIDKLLASL